MKYKFLRNFKSQKSSYHGQQQLLLLKLLIYMPQKISLNRTNQRKRITTSRIPQPLQITTKNYIGFDPTPRKILKRQSEQAEGAFCDCFTKEGEEQIYISPSKVISREQLLKEPKWRFCQTVETQE